MNDFLRRAESILEVAAAPGADSQGAAIVVDRAGCLRVMNPEGWTLAGLITEFGAREVYMVQQRSGAITVDGWSPNDRCTITRKQARTVFAGLPPCFPQVGYAARSQAIPQLSV